MFLCQLNEMQFMFPDFFFCTIHALLLGQANVIKFCSLASALSPTTSGQDTWSVCTYTLCCILSRFYYYHPHVL